MFNNINAPAFKGYLQVRIGDAFCKGNKTTFEEDQKMVDVLEDTYQWSRNMLQLNGKGEVELRTGSAVDTNNGLLKVTNKSIISDQTTTWSINSAQYSPENTKDPAKNALYQKIQDLIGIIKGHQQKLLSGDKINFDFEKQNFLTNLKTKI